MNDVFRIISENNVLLAALVGAAASIYIYKIQYKKTTYFEMYKRCYAPIYHLLREDIDLLTILLTPRNTFKRSSVNISSFQIELYKDELLKLLDREYSYCPETLYSKTVGLNKENYSDYCLFIWDNYSACQQRLGIYALKPSVSMFTRRLRSAFYLLIVLLFLFLIVASVLFVVSDNLSMAISSIVMCLCLLLLILLTKDS